ncbi:MAG: hypothetical protein JSU85_10600 [Candidatus Zixiibacteriota bacterium]|nr:MAG: hypothetical protein JSU85_10600 [candidate division Zixibacteria bacterium]
MAFTTREIVKKHILDHHLGSENVENEKTRFQGTDWIQLYKRMILGGSEKIKGKEQIEPTREDISFDTADIQNLSHTELIPDTVVAAGDSSLGIIYIENVDYHVDYDIGRITRITTGSIPQGAAIAVWYLYYRVYEKGVDYDIDYQRGRVRRRSGGAIESGQWICADYTAEYGSLDDDAIANAISEANSRIMDFIDGIHHDSNDKLLVSAETYLAVSIICKIRAMESISPSRGKTESADAMSWTALSDMYKKEAFNILSKYAAPGDNLNSPSKA